MLSYITFDNDMSEVLIDGNPGADTPCDCWKKKGQRRSAEHCAHLAVSGYGLDRLAVYGFLDLDYEPIHC